MNIDDACCEILVDISMPVCNIDFSKDREFSEMPVYETEFDQLYELLSDIHDGELRSSIGRALYSLEINLRKDAGEPLKSREYGNLANNRHITRKRPSYSMV